MNKKILFTASISFHIKAFHVPYLKWFKSQGYEVHTVSNDVGDIPYVDKSWKIPVERSPYKLKNISAFKALKKLIDKENYQIIHCHTPMASVLTRLASYRAKKNGTKVLYTAHGFHFFKGASLINWLIYYPIELILTYFTDAIICINFEDYYRIKKNGSKNCDYYMIPGIGVEDERFYPVSLDTKTELRKQKNIPLDKFIIIYSAELIQRKNHRFIINAVNENKDNLNDVLFLFAGKGENKEELEALVSHYKLNKMINFIGFRVDIDEIYQLSDLGVSSSTQEGLPLNLVEEMMCGLPVIGTDIRGHKEIIDNGLNGFLVNLKDKNQFINRIIELKDNKNLFELFRENAINKASKFSIYKSLSCMSEIYKNYMD